MKRSEKLAIPPMEINEVPDNAHHTFYWKAIGGTGWIFWPALEQ